VENKNGTQVTTELYPNPIPDLYAMFPINIFVNTLSMEHSLNQ